MKRISGIYRLLILASMCLLTTLVVHTSVPATVIFSWSNAPIKGQRDDFDPSGWASFEVNTGSSGSSGLQLVVTLTYTTSQEIVTIGEVLTGVAFDINNNGVSLTKVSAVMQSSVLIGHEANLYNPQPTDLSCEWAYIGYIDAGSSALGPLGEHIIGTMGDINFAVATFGKHDRFDTSTNLFGPDGVNGVEAGIVGSKVDLTKNGLKNNGPLVQGNPGGGGQMVFTFDVSGNNLQESDIGNVQPLFGTDGAPLAPEPGTLLLVGSGLVGLAGYAKLRFRRKREQ